VSGVPIRFVLGLLRRLKSTSDLTRGNSAQQYVEVWARGGGQEAQFRILITIQQNLVEARQVIEASGLSDEAKGGLYATIDSLIATFAIGNFQGAVSNYLLDLDTAITIFSVITSAIDFDVPEQFVTERDELVNDLNLFIEELASLDVDERLRDTARRQVSLLIALLRNAEAIGVEAALASYYEMVIKLRNRSAANPDSQSEGKSKFWSTIKSWSDRLDSLSKIYDIGQRLLPHVDKIPQIPGFL
jgi:hypothetical protein